MRVTLMHNPSAGDVASSADDLLRALAAAGHHVVYQSTKDGAKVDEALANPGDLVVAAGGDGTVRKIASRLAGRGVPMAILPLGSSNNIARSLGQIGPRQKLIEGWREGVRRPVDLGVVRGSWGETHFLESVGWGIFARFFPLTVRQGGLGRGDLTGHSVDRALQMLEEAVETQGALSCSVRLDGRELREPCLAIEAMNIRFVGPSVPLAPRAEPDDGWLDVVTIPEKERSVLLDYVHERLRGHAKDPVLTVHRARCLRVTGCDEPMHVDGELRMKRVDEPQGEVEVTLGKGAVEFVLSSPRTVGKEALGP